MKKRFTCLFLCVLLLVGIMPAKAIDIVPDEAGMPIVQTTLQASPDNELMLASSIVPRAYVTQIAIYPVANVVGLNSEYYVSTIRRCYKFTTYYQFASLALSQAGTKQLLQEFENYLNSKSYSYTLVGWRIEVDVSLAAPRMISYTPFIRGSHLTQITQTAKYLSGTSTTLRQTAVVRFPQNIDLATEKYNFEVGGLFTYQASNGNQVSREVSGDCFLNSTRTNTGGSFVR